MLPPEQRDAFYQLVLHPAKASAMVAEMNIAAGRNHAVRHAGPGEHQRRGRARARALPAGPGDERLLQPQTGRRQMGPPHGPDPPRPVQLGAAERRCDARRFPRCCRPTTTASASRSKATSTPGPATSATPCCPPSIRSGRRRSYVDVFADGHAADRVLDRGRTALDRAHRGHGAAPRSALLGGHRLDEGAGRHLDRRDHGHGRSAAP